MSARDSPWDVACTVLFDRTGWLAAYEAGDDLQAVTRRLALWQIIYYLRVPDGGRAYQYLGAAPFEDDLGLVDYTDSALWLALGTATGSYAASGWAVAKGADAMRRVIVAVTSVMLLYTAGKFVLALLALR